MHALNASELLDIWDSGRSVSPSCRSLLLLGAVYPDERESLPGLPLGEITARLLKVRARLFGSVLTCVTTCDVCKTIVETEVGIDELLGDEPTHQDGESLFHSIRQGDIAFNFRLPTISDLLEVDRVKSINAKQFARRLICGTIGNSENVEIEDLSQDMIEAMEKQISELDPLAQIELRISCPECGNRWAEPLHMIDYLWLEISHLAKRLLLEVVQLASAFGWREQEILALTPERRRSYLELLRA
jgi:hypothetical protein